MATGPASTTIMFMPTVPPGPLASATIISSPSPGAGPTSSFDLGDNQKRWVVVGISLNAVLLPVLRQFTGQEISKHFLSLKTTRKLDTQTYGTHMASDGRFQLNYGSINNNWRKYKKKVGSYDYKVNSAEDFAKLYLEAHMAKLTGFDSTCDLSAVLGIQANASVFPALVQNNAKDVRTEVRNEWGHCIFDHWTKSKFSKCFQLMETLVRSLGLPPGDTTKVLGDLGDWEKKGLQLCMGCPVDSDLMKLVSDEVANLELDVERIKQGRRDEERKLTDALQGVRNEIKNFNKRIQELENQVAVNRKEQIKQKEALSDAFRDISSDLMDLEIRQGKDEENISELHERQNVLEAAACSMKVESIHLASRVEGIETRQDKMDGRMEALESLVEGQSRRSATANTFQAPSQNQWFCGRSKELENILRHLKVAGKTCAHTAICGLGGVGKTSLAIEYLWRYKEEYPGGVFWISGESNSLFQISLSDMARQIGTLKKDFHNTLSETLDWLRNRDQIWCLIFDNLDELEMSADLCRVLTGHWKQAARGHIIVTTRRETTEAAEDTGFEEQWCIDLKCLTEEDGLQFLRMRTNKASGEDEAIRELFRELGGLPLALEQAAAYIRCLRCSCSDYVTQYKKQKLLLLKKKKARFRVENTSPDRLAVHTTWLLNFEHIRQISKDTELGEAVTLFMELSAFLGPDDIPYEVINVGAPQLDSKDLAQIISSSLGAPEIMSLLTKLSLFQRYGTNSYSVHRLVQEVIRSRMKKEREEFVLSCATRVLHFALLNTQSPAYVCKRFVEDAVFSVDNPPSLHLWGRLASHATYLQEHLLKFVSRHEQSAYTLLHTEPSVCLFNEAAIFFEVAREKIKAQEMQQRKLEIVLHLENSTSEENPELPEYFVDIPLKDKDYKLFSHCMRQPPAQDVDEDSNQDYTGTNEEEEANQLREQGNLAVKKNQYKEAIDLYNKAIALPCEDYRLFSNRALCYLKTGQPREALDDCEKCLTLEHHYSKALQRKAWALHELSGQENSGYYKGCAVATAALAIHFDATLRNDQMFKKMFPDVYFTVISNATHFAFSLMTAGKNQTLIVQEGEYYLEHFWVFNDLQFVGLSPRVTLKCNKSCMVFNGKCYFENIVFPKGNVSLVCRGKTGVISMNNCKISGGCASCEDYPECNGGPGCIAPSFQKPMCDRRNRFGIQELSGIGGIHGLQIFEGSSGHINHCEIYNCGGGGALVHGDGSRLFIRNCEVFKNHQAGLEAREGGKLVALDNRVYDNRFHGVLIGPKAGISEVQGNQIFENAQEGMLVVKTKDELSIKDNDIHHNQQFGLSLDNSTVSISNNRIFENGFWGIIATSRTTANVTQNLISGNKCGGIFIGINFAARIQIESNIVRDHCGPWLEYPNERGTFKGIDLSDFPANDFFRLPQGEKHCYSRPPILVDNKEFNNEEGMFHPRQMVNRLQSECLFCRRSRKNVGRLKSCPRCHIAMYCGQECQMHHWPKHKPLCDALKSRFSVTVELIEFPTRGHHTIRIFGTHLRGIGKGPKPNRNSGKTFIVKIQTGTLNSHPLQLLTVYDKSLTVEGEIQSKEIFAIIMECGVLGALNKLTSKKVFLWAKFAAGGRKLLIFLDRLAPYQEW